jgi:hypothetical protein
MELWVHNLIVMEKASKYTWRVILFFIVPLTLYTLYSGFSVGEMELPGGFRITFQKNQTMESPVKEQLEQQSDREREQRQMELEQEMKGLKGRLDSRPSEPMSVDLNGIWYGNNGVTYQIEQQGTSFTIQEQSPYYGITAVGNGQVSGRQLSFDYQTAAYTQGRGELQLSADGRTLQGSFQDYSTGMMIPAYLSR